MNEILKEVHKSINDVTKIAIEQFVKLEDQRVLNAIIGSTILDLKLEKIPNRKTLYTLYIRTSAPSILALKFNFEQDRLEIIENSRVFISPSELKVRVKL